MKIAFIAVAASCLMTTGAPAAELENCPSPETVSSGETAFGTYCVRCHDAAKLASQYFGQASEEEKALREAELAKFLDRHSSCPHRNHEDIAAWLRQVSEDPAR